MTKDDEQEPQQVDSVPKDVKEEVDPEETEAEEDSADEHQPPTSTGDEKGAKSSKTVEAVEDDGGTANGDSNNEADDDDDDEEEEAEAKEAATATAAAAVAVPKPKASTTSTTIAADTNTSTTTHSSVPIMMTLPNLVTDEEGTAIPEASNGSSMYQYRDFSNVPEEELERQPHAGPPPPNHNSSRGPVEASIRVQKFPVKLYAILAQKEFQDIITWMPHGRSWKVLKPNLFESLVMPLFFEYSNYHSFNRLVNAWSFRRISTGPDRGSYYHELFLRGKPYLQKYMRRLPKTHKKLPMKKEDEPDFYGMDKANPLPALEETTLPPHAGASAVVGGGMMGGAGGPGMPPGMPGGMMGGMMGGGAGGGMPGGMMNPGGGMGGMMRHHGGGMGGMMSPFGMGGGMPGGGMMNPGGGMGGMGMAGGNHSMMRPGGGMGGGMGGNMGGGMHFPYGGGAMGMGAGADGGAFKDPLLGRGSGMSMAGGMGGGPMSMGLTMQERMMMQQGGGGMMGLSGGGLTMQERMMMQNQGGSGMMDSMNMPPPSMMGTSAFRETQFGGAGAGGGGAGEMEFQRLRQIQQMRMMEQQHGGGSPSGPGAVGDSMSPAARMQNMEGGMGMRGMGRS